MSAAELLPALKALKLECTVDLLNPCWNDRPSDDRRPGLHWGSEPGHPIPACPSCLVNAAIAKAERGVPGLEIAKMLVLCTSHVSRETADQLDDEQPGYCKGEYGWFVPVYEDPGLYPPDLAACMEFARANGCDWLMFDRDGEEIDALPTFDW